MYKLQPTDIEYFFLVPNINNLATMNFSYVASTSKAKYEMIFTFIKRGIFSQG